MRKFGRNVWGAGLALVTVTASLPATAAMLPVSTETPLSSRSESNSARPTILVHGADDGRYRLRLFNRTPTSPYYSYGYPRLYHYPWGLHPVRRHWRR